MSIDLHIHIIPGIDDGARTPVVSNSMLSHLAVTGVTTVVATPHLMEPLTPEYLHAAENGLDTVRKLAKPHGISVELGFEHMLAPDTTERLTAGEASTLAGSQAVLVELPFEFWPTHTTSSLLSLRQSGHRAVLAHPERYRAAMADPEMVLDASLQGASLQLTSGSFAGLYGKEVAQLAKHFLQCAIGRDLPIVLASDAHSDGSRLTSAAQGHEWIARNIDEGALVVEWASTHVPSALLRDEPSQPYAVWRDALDPEAARRVLDSASIPESESENGIGSLWRRLTGSRT